MPSTHMACNATKQTVTLAINNLDEVAPSFDSAPSATPSFPTRRSSDLVYTAAATDPALDDGPSNPVTYSFGGGTDDGAFSINPTTGAVTLTADPKNGSAQS